MDKVNVLILAVRSAHQGYLEEITAVDPRISVKDGTRQVLAELRRKGMKGPGIDRLEKETTLGRDRQVSDTQENLDALLAQADAIKGCVSPAPAGIGPSAPFSSGESASFPRACGDRPACKPYNRHLRAFPPRLRG